MRTAEETTALAHALADCDPALVCAAPELFAALQQALKLIDAYRKAFGGDGDITALLAREAIAAARGEA